MSAGTSARAVCDSVPQPARPPAARIPCRWVRLSCYCMMGDRAYWSHRYHRELRRRKIKPQIAPPKSPHGSGLGKERWVVERTISWLHQKRKLPIRYERRDDIHEALLQIGCALICFSLLQAAGSFR